MKKELKSCKGVLLRADLTGNGHSTKSCQNGWDGRALKRTPMQDFNSFSIMFYYIISNTYQNYFFTKVKKKYIFTKLLCPFIC